MTFGWMLVLFAAVSTAAANLCLRAGVLRAGAFASKSGIPGMVTALLSEPAFVIGLFLYFLAAVIWFRVLSAMDVSLSYPVLVGVSFIIITAGSWMFFHEQISWAKLCGMAVILAGILIVSRA